MVKDQENGFKIANIKTLKKDDKGMMNEEEEDALEQIQLTQMANERIEEIPNKIPISIKISISIKNSNLDSGLFYTTK